MLGSVNVPGVGKNELDAVRQTAENAVSAAAAAQKTADEAKITADEAKTAAESGGGSGTGGIELADVTNVKVVAGDARVAITWADPADIVYNGATLARWAGTKIVRKAGSVPASESDGTLVVNSLTRNGYSNTAYEDAGVTNGTTYCYCFFPYTTSGTHTKGTNFSATPNKLVPNLSVSESDVRINSGRKSNTKNIMVTSNSSGTLSVESSNTSIVTATISGSTVTIKYVAPGTATVTVKQTAYGDYTSNEVTISVSAIYGVRYGYRIKKSESNPSTRVEYLYDAVGLTPAAMNFTAGKFSYGDWGDKWFVTENKPLMLKNDGMVDYYLNPNDYTKKEDGTASDVANTNYAGNAMAQIPLCWVRRYEEGDYEYEIVSDVQYDENYKAYAHTRADGTIADFFYYSMFGGSGNATKIRSLSDQTLAASLTAGNKIAGAKANGAKWYIHSWSQHELIRTPCILLGRSTDVQSVFGNGNCRSGSNGSVLKSGTLKNMGQFFGYNTNTQQVKVFHIEKFWGDQWDRTAGCINNNGKIHIKMTPEGEGYHITDVTGYHNTDITLAGTNGGYISVGMMSEYGFIPKTISGSGTTYYCDGAWFNNSDLKYLIAGASAVNATTFGGAFTFDVHVAPSDAHWNNGCGLSYRNLSIFNAPHNPQPLLKIARYRVGIVSRKA